MSTENRSVLHIALRAPRDKAFYTDGKNVVPEVWHVLDKIKDFSERVRNGSWVGAIGKALKDVLAIGIGGSFLGPPYLCILHCRQTQRLQILLKGDNYDYSGFRNGTLYLCKHKEHSLSQPIFDTISCSLANVDPVDVAQSINGLNPETTLVVVVSMTFTTAETMLNARTMREWISSALGPQAVAKHMVAVNTNLVLVEKFGIDPANAFAFWDWVGGRYSVCSAVGVLPLFIWLSNC